jgi:acetamidase/formamidase
MTPRRRTEHRAVARRGEELAVGAVDHLLAEHLPQALRDAAVDLAFDDAAKQALRHMIAWLVQMKGWKPAEAYVFCSLACDLRVTQLIDGNKGVHAMVARRLID